MKEQITTALIMTAIILVVQAFAIRYTWNQLVKAESRIAAIERSMGFIVQD